MKAEEISVVLTTRNRKYELRRAIESVYGQTCLPGEVIVIDSGDDRGVQRYIGSFSFPGLVYIRLPEGERRGSTVGSVRNAGIAAAQGNYIAFLDSDDEWHKNRLEICVDVIRKKELDILSCQYNKHVRRERRTLPEMRLLENGNLLQSALRQNLAVGSATIYRRAFLDGIGMFDPRLNHTADWELFIRAAQKRDVRFEMIPVPLAETWTMHDSVSMSESAEKERREMFSAFESEIFRIQDVSEAIKKETDKSERMARRKNAFYLLMRDWMEMRLSGRSVAQELTKKGIGTVVIYGAGKHGELLFRELGSSDIRIAAWLDAKKTDKTYRGVPLYDPARYIPDVDAVIVTPYLEFDRIAGLLRENTSARILSLRDLVTLTDGNEAAAGVGERPNRDIRDICRYIDDHYGKEDYSDILRNDTRYPIWENLSDQRQASISWYPFDSQGSALEIGAGFGAMTGALCDRVGRVVAVEPDRLKAEYLRKRYVNRTNLRICTDNIWEMAAEERFDYVILFQQLEIIGDRAAEDACVKYLRHLRKFLKPDGIVLLAADNIYGVRNLCGLADKYTHVPFDALAGYPEGSAGRLFTREQLCGLIDHAGFSKRKFYYPVSDYRMPRVIYTDGLMPDATITERSDSYYASRCGMIADDKKVYHDAAVNRAFHFLSNSYLVEITDGGKLCDADYISVSPYRGRKKAFAIIVEKEKGRVRKKWLFPEGKAYAEAICRSAGELKQKNIPILEMRMEQDAISMEYIRAKTVQQHIMELVGKNERPEAFFKIFDDMWSYIVKSSGHGDESEWKTDFEELGPILKEASVELIPINCFWLEGTYLFFDQEFIMENIPAKYVLFRGIDICLKYVRGIDRLVSRSAFQDRYKISDALWDYFREKEKLFLRTVNPNSLPWTPGRPADMLRNRKALMG